MKHNYNIGPKLSKTQSILGWLYLPFYFSLNSLLLQYLAKLLDFPLTDFALNVLYFTLNFVVVMAVFGRFLAKSLRGFTKHFWNFIQSLILGFALYYFLTLALTKLIALLVGPVPNFNDEIILEHISRNRTVMLLCTVAAAPIVEEMLIRGVVFGSLYRVNRIAAYVVSILLFCLMHVWQFFGTADIVSLLLGALQYVPAALALGWIYEKAGTVWAPIVLHALINAISFYAYTLF